jgi:hypothetical protein
LESWLLEVLLLGWWLTEGPIVVHALERKVASIGGSSTELLRETLAEGAWVRMLLHGVLSKGLLMLNISNYTRLINLLTDERVEDLQVASGMKCWLPIFSQYLN